jgi:hypothetical protein
MNNGIPPLGVASSQPALHCSERDARAEKSEKSNFPLVHTQRIKMGNTREKAIHRSGRSGGCDAGISLKLGRRARSCDVSLIATWISSAQAISYEVMPSDHG